jgi:hypothetical protein
MTTVRYPEITATQAEMLFPLYLAKLVLLVSFQCSSIPESVRRDAVAADEPEPKVEFD